MASQTHKRNRSESDHPPGRPIPSTMPNQEEPIQESQITDNLASAPSPGAEIDMHREDEVDQSLTPVEAHGHSHDHGGRQPDLMDYDGTHDQRLTSPDYQEDESRLEQSEELQDISEEVLDQERPLAGHSMTEDASDANCGGDNDLTQTAARRRLLLVPESQIPPNVSEVVDIDMEDMDVPVGERSAPASMAHHPSRFGTGQNAPSTFRFNLSSNTAFGRTVDHEIPSPSPVPRTSRLGTNMTGFGHLGASSPATPTPPFMRYSSRPNKSPLHGTQFVHKDSAGTDSSTPTFEVPGRGIMTVEGILRDHWRDLQRFAKDAGQRASPVRRFLSHTTDVEVHTVVFDKSIHCPSVLPVACRMTDSARYYVGCQWVNETNFVFSGEIHESRAEEERKQFQGFLSHLYLDDEPTGASFVRRICIPGFSRAGQEFVRLVEDFDNLEVLGLGCSPDDMSNIHPNEWAAHCGLDALVGNLKSLKTLTLILAPKYKPDFVATEASTPVAPRGRKKTTPVQPRLVHAPPPQSYSAVQQWLRNLGEHLQAALSNTDAEVFLDVKGSWELDYKVKPTKLVRAT